MNIGNNFKNWKIITDGTGSVDLTNPASAVITSSVGGRNYLRALCVVGGGSTLDFKLCCQLENGGTGHASILVVPLSGGGGVGTTQTEEIILSQDMIDYSISYKAPAIAVDTTVLILIGFRSENAGTVKAFNPRVSISGNSYGCHSVIASGCVAVSQSSVALSSEHISTGITGLTWDSVAKRINVALNSVLYEYEGLTELPLCTVSTRTSFLTNYNVTWHYNEDATGARAPYFIGVVNSTGALFDIATLSSGHTLKFDFCIFHR